MNPFERHGIAHLSPSSLRLYRDDPAAWCVRYLCRVKDDGGPGAWRGSAVEAGLDRILFRAGVETAAKAMRDKWDELAMGVVDEKAAKEYELLPDYLAQAQKALAGRDTPLSLQSKISVSIPGIEVPVIGFIDYRWPDCGLDLKTTLRMPSEPNPAHVEQVAVYAKATGVPFSLLYVTPKKWAVYEITAPMVEEAYTGVLRGAYAIRHMLSKVDSARDALRLYSPDFTNYQWSPPMIEAATQIYQGVN